MSASTRVVCRAVAHEIAARGRWSDKECDYYLTAGDFDSCFASVAERTGVAVKRIQELAVCTTTDDGVVMFARANAAHGLALRR